TVVTDDLSHTNFGADNDLHFYLSFNFITLLKLDFRAGFSGRVFLATRDLTPYLVITSNYSTLFWRLQEVF
ncbi:hypothetical protein IKF84_02690, partial [Candidatus Saccharibacteria bacterium]|nr:hypothetical protein [Candidatus Saccharibacteria bacterium]